MSVALSTLRRGLEIVSLLHTPNPGPDFGGWSNSQISERLGLDKSQVSRTLQVLEELGYVKRFGDGRTYGLGLPLFGIGMRAVDQDLLRAGSVVVREIVRLTRSRAYLVVRDGMSVVTLWSDQPPEVRPRVHSIGMSFPIGIAETGRALLYNASPEEISEVTRDMAERGLGHGDQLAHQIALDRAAGYSWRRASDESGIAVPVWGSNDSGIIASLGCSSQSLTDRAPATSAADLLITAAADLSKRASRSGQPARKTPSDSVPYSGWPNSPNDLFPAELFDRPEEDPPEALDG